ncbi:hypothetical protein PVIIG_06064 [Plasmodium vivax India VII]|uniref:Uncharacterized protein n=1 Tax=Plasmodium vivax India VII TaxID=1077284 RepID=A0A0J9UUM6_PLAVI|nr:hypothetical protein PVIIG_06064 [Plasmodium vivax India VII]
MEHNFLFQNAIIDLFDILINDRGKICTAPPYYIDQHHFKNIKFFFDYSEDYNTYIGQLNTHNPPCNEKYKNYLKSYVDSYNKFKAICQNERPSYSYCNVFNEYFADKNPTHLSTWTCRLEHREPEEMKVYDDTEAMKEKPPKMYTMGEQSTNIRGELEGVREQGAELLSSSDYLSDASFTPAGAWINKFFGRNQMNRSPLTEAQLIENFHQPVDFNSERHRYNISYRHG